MNKEIMSCVKGIEKLRIEEKDWDDIQNSRIIGIYGPNGVGKSSFKNGLMNVKEDLNWNCANNKEEVFIDVSLKLQIFGTFDENLVELVKGNVHNLSFLNSKISNFFELLTQRDQRDKALNKELKEMLKLDFFKSDNDNFRNYFKKLQEFKSILESAKKLNNFFEKNKNEEWVNKEKNSIIKGRCKKFVKKFNSFGDGLLEVRIYFNENTQLHTFNGRNWNSHKDKIAHSLDLFVNGKYDDDINKELSNCITKIEDYLKTLYTIKNNFGYIDIDKTINLDENIFNELIKDNYFTFSNEKNSLGLEISEFLEKFKTKKINKDSFFSSWEEILKNINSVTKLANKILDLYGLGYKIDLFPNLLNEKKENQSNLKLVHKDSDKTIEQEDIFKKVSYGEMNIISFCLFIASFIERNKRDNKKEYQLIFDDPISSYDLNKINITISIIEKLINSNKNLNKIFILTHEKHFLKQVKNYFNNKSSKNSRYFFLEKNNNIHHLKSSELNDDLKNYIDLLKSKNERTKLIAQRTIGLIIKKIIEESKNISKKEINKIINDVLIELGVIDAKNQFNKISNKFKNKKLNVDLKNKENINKEDLYSIRNNFDQEFLDWIDKKNEEIDLEKIDEGENYKLFKAQIYIRILNRIIHGEDNLLNLDLSRTTEIVDILFSNKEDLIVTLSKCKNIFEKIIK